MFLFDLFPLECHADISSAQRAHNYRRYFFVPSPHALTTLNCKLVRRT